MRRLLWLLVPLLLALGYAATVGWQAWQKERTLQVARDALQRRDLDTALDLLSAVLERSPDDENAWLMLAQVHRLRGKLEDAEDALDRADRLGVKDRPAYLLERTLLNVTRRGFTPLEEDYLTTRAESAGRHDSRLIFECLVPFYLGDYRLGEALAAADTWLERDPGWSPALVLRGQIRQSMGHADRALEDFHAAFDADPSSSEARLRLAVALLAREPDEAAQHFRKLQEGGFQDREVVLGLASAIAGSAPDVSARLLDGWLKDHPSDPAALYQRGMIAVQRQDWSAAEPYFNKALEADPGDREAVYQLHVCCVMSGRAEEARKLKERLARIDADLKELRECVRRGGEEPNDPQPLYEAGMICRRNGHAAEAERWFRAALRRDPWHRATLEAISGPRR